MASDEGLAQRKRGKIALVTGAGRGIGWGIASAIADETSELILADLDVEAAAERVEELRRRGRRARALAVDVSSEASVEALAAKCLELAGAPDIVVNNAGISGLRNGERPSIAEHTLEEWNRSLAVNLTGVFLISRAFIPSMQKRGWGRIVNISSAAGRVHIAMAPGPYSAAKAGVIALTKTLAGELGPFGITVNAVAPGRIDTAMGAEQKRPVEYLDRIPMRRTGAPADVAAAVKFLISEGADYITGATIDVGGGFYMA